jgi:hypothetical protein
MTAGFYETDNSDLEVQVIRVTYRDPAGKYVKVKVNLFNKHNGIQYESNRNYKLYTKNITHWKRTK